jgi:ech hydrogenase subunit B
MVDMMKLDYILPILYVLAAPLMGGLMVGLDRKITARMQGRVGPPLLQPFYDVIKLWGKEPFISSRMQPILATGYLVFIFTGLTLLALGGDLLHILFTLTLADVCLIVSAYNSESPYSNLGGRRELLAMLSYEPIMVLTAMSIQIVTGSFLVSGIFRYGTPLLLVMPAAFVAQILVLIIDMKKSPYDVSGSGHAHQELVRGVYTEFSGYTMALVELGHWTKTVFILSLISLFWAHNLLFGAVLSLALWFAAILADNIYPRLNWKIMLKTTWLTGFTLILANFVVLIVLEVI